MQLRTRVREAIRRVGYDVHRLTGDLGEEPFRDIAKLSSTRPGLVCLDIGANVGQTIDRLTAALDRPRVHSFEPGPDSFAELSRSYGGRADVQLVNAAVGAEPGELELIEFVQSDMSSLLEPGPEPMGPVKGRVAVEVRTLDDYCAAAGIERVEVLKSDTQGFELEVLRGASGLLGAGAVHLVLIEINLNDAYRGLPRLDEIYGYCHDHGLRLVSLYNMHYLADRLSWADALFIAPEFNA